ncbi:MAG: alpha/beta fold hydrolase [Rhodospirillaceae bacterium]|nr:alpha/beta fold hydrolase [Rhodospirillaceae bacterium]
MTPAPITRHFLPLTYPGADGRQVHYRRAGSGPALILMHPSPNSSASMTGAINAFSSAFTCIALDTPGYGLSDAIVDDATLLWGYADALAQIMDALKLDQAFIYGAATGAQIGVQFARRYPSRVHVLLLDANGDFTDEDISDGYFRDITPRRDGSHLLTIWDMCRHLSVFFPWQSTRAEHRLDVDVASPVWIQHSVNDYLRAGPSYKDAYYQAMLVERWEHTREVKVPVLMTRNAGSALLRHTDALIAKGLPGNFTILQCEPRNRYPMQLTALQAWMAGKSYPSAPPAPADVQPKSARIQNMYLKARGGHVRARVNLAGAGRPLVALHDPAGAASLVEPVIAPYVGRRPVIALDLPGNGESDNLIGDPAFGGSPDAITSANYAAIVNEALAGAGLDSVDVFGRYSGGPVAMEMSFQAPKRVARLALAGIGMYEGEEQKSLMDNYTPSIAPKWDGSHLVTAWAIMRDQGLFWPWFNRTRAGILRADNAIDVAMIHLRVTEMLKIGDQYQKAYGAMWTYPMRAKLPQLKHPTLICAPAWEPIYAKMAACHDVAPQTRTAVLPPRMGEWWRVMDDFWTS